jgi:hypothetical protein
MTAPAAAFLFALQPAAAPAADLAFLAAPVVPAAPVAPVALAIPAALPVPASGQAVLAPLAAAPALPAPPPTVTVTPDRKTLSLSESLHAILTIEGPAPLRVEVPAPVLLPASERDWRVRPTGPPRVSPSGDGRETWTQGFRLDPYTPGEQYVLFAPFTVNGREVPGPGFEVRVISTVSEAKAEAARPVTGVEAPPSPAADSGVSRAPWVVGGLLGVAVVVVVVAVAVVARWYRRPPGPVPAYGRALAALDRLERDGVSGQALAESVAAVLREFVEGRFGIPAARLTSSELLAAAEQAVGSVEKADRLRRILDGLDRVRFGGEVADDRGCRGLADAVREWLHQVGPAGPRPG